MSLHDAVLKKKREGCVAGKRAEHEDLTMGEIDHEEDAVDEGVAEGDQGVDPPMVNPLIS